MIQGFEQSTHQLHKNINTTRGQYFSKKLSCRLMQSAWSDLIDLSKSSAHTGEVFALSCSVSGNEAILHMKLDELAYCIKHTSVNATLVQF